MKSLASQVREQWRSRGLSVVAPSEASLIQEKLSAAGLQVGRDFTDFLAVVGGMVDGESDFDLWSAWSLELIITENRTIQKEGVYFADWLIHSHLHFVRRESPEISSVWTDGFESLGVTKVAESLEEFLTRYLARDQSIGIYFEHENEINRG